MIFDCIVPDQINHLCQTLQSCVPNSVSQIPFETSSTSTATTTSFSSSSLSSSSSSPSYSIPKQILVTFQFSESTGKIQLLLTIWMIQQQQSPNSEPNYFQLMFLPVTNEIQNQLISSKSSTSSTISTTSMSASLSPTSPSLLSKDGISLIASSRFPLPEPSPDIPSINSHSVHTLQYDYSSMLSNHNDCSSYFQSTSFRSSHDIEDNSDGYTTNFTPRIITTVTEHSNEDGTFNSSSSYSTQESPQMILYSNSNDNSNPTNNAYLITTYPPLTLPYFPIVAHLHQNQNQNQNNETLLHHHHQYQYHQYQYNYQEFYLNHHNNSGNIENNDQNNNSLDDSDEPFENIPDDWFDQDGEEEFEDES